MLTRNRARVQERRGIALILILGMLGLLAFIGVTFATIAGQARIGARNYAQSVMRPQPAELMEFALAQLIGDTDDPRSAIRGHSLARDMYGNDAQNNGYVDQSEGVHFTTGAAVTDPSLVDPSGRSLLGTLQCVTSLPIANSAASPYYGYDFSRWVVKFDGQSLASGGGWGSLRVGQTYEIVYDDALSLTRAFNPTRVFYLAPLSPQSAGSRSGYSSPESGYTGVRAVNSSMLIGEYAYYMQGLAVQINVPFSIDGRFLRAFNGPGMGPLAQYANMRYNGGILAGDPSASSVRPGRPNVVGMDEDYDACDLENWFLAIQSADGKTVVPSFHRPGIVQQSDWTSLLGPSRSRILRPRAIDGHSAVAFPDLNPGLPDIYNGRRIDFDVDNDADGTTDSVWVDLGYPPIQDNRGMLYKPMFSFMVLGLNGRIPLNTAGNLNRRDGAGNPVYMHASHLGYSPSEIDPTFGLQNWPYLPGGIAPDPTTQLDDALGTNLSGNPATLPVSVNVTQLRNILAGTRPNVGGNSNDRNTLLYFATYGIGPYLLPNNLPDFKDNFGGGLAPLPSRSVPGRWGEASLITNLFNINAGNPQLYTPLMTYPNPVRAGLSMTGTNQLAQVADGRDDNDTARDYWPGFAFGLPEFPGNAAPLASATLPDGMTPWPADYRDAAGDWPVLAERARRYVTPMDLNGDGQQFNYRTTNTRGADEYGRVRYNNYFRPPGVPPATVDGVPVPTAIAGKGTSVDGMPSAVDVTSNPFHGFESQRNPSLKSVISNSWRQALSNAAAPTSLDAAGNDGAGAAGGPVPTSGGLPYDSSGNPTGSFSAKINSLLPGAPGLNEPDETNLYTPNGTDQVFGAQDLEWLYRAHDVDGSALYSRLPELAPLSFRDALDAMRRRRLYSIDVSETNAFAWTNDNPGGFNSLGIYTGGKFNDNSRFPTPFVVNPANGLPALAPVLYPAAPASAMAGVLANAGTPALAGIPSKGLAGYPFVQPTANGQPQATAPSLAQRDRKINLNYPLPVSNDSNEPTRLKWIAESYQLLKAVLPPLSVDTPEELAALSQFLVNIVDFRDPDATMTRFVNPDVCIRPSTTLGQAPDLLLRTNPLWNGATDLALVQYGMEYNPIAINEVLAYAFQTKGSPAWIPRFFIEMVNTLTDAQTAYPTPNDASNASWLNLGGPQYVADNPYGVGAVGGCWDLIFTDDDPSARPDPFTGQIPQTATTGFYGPVPLHRGSFSTNQDVIIRPLSADGPSATGPNYYYCIGNAIALPNSETGSPAPPKVVQTFKPDFDPFQEPSAQSPPTFTIPPGVLPKDATTYPSGRITAPQPVQTGSKYQWVCLRRPANPFAPVSAANPMVVVDSMRFPYIEATGKLVGSTKKDDKGQPVPDTTAANQVYSIERFQPYRGGQLVPQGSGTVLSPARYLDVTRYGYTEQTVADQTSTGLQGVYSRSSDGKTIYPSTKAVFHSLGAAGATSGGTLTERWDRFVFNDRDFTSPAELMLVPGCPPGLFTKQFVEFAPSTANRARFYNAGVPALGQRYVTPPSSVSGVPTSLGAKLVTDPSTFPYLADQLFYTSASPAYNGGAGTAAAYTTSTPASWDPVVGPSSGGWFKMFEIFEVPSTAIGATGTVAQGVNYDRLRQDVRPGQLNLNLIIDEEVFLGLMGNAGVRGDGRPRASDLAAIPIMAGGDATPLQAVLTVPTYLNGVPIPFSPATPRVVTQVDSMGVPTASYNMSGAGFYSMAGTFPALKQAFVDFLSIRHGANPPGTAGQPYPTYAYVDTANPMNSTNYLFFGATQAVEAPFRSLTYPDIDATIMRPAYPTLNATTIQTTPPALALKMLDHGTTLQDAGVKSVGLLSRTYPFVQSSPYYPPAMPPRRLFQIPDTERGNATRTLTDTGQIGYAPPQMGNLMDPNVSMTNNVDPAKVLNAEEQHPYYRSEWLQKLMNLSTVRTHQYAVWITVGFFEVTAVGDPAAAQTNPDAAYDVLGREVGTLAGKTFRHRGFFIVDRLKLSGFDPRNPGQYKDAVLYRKLIQ